MTSSSERMSGGHLVLTCRNRGIRARGAPGAVWPGFSLGVSPSELHSVYPAVWNGSKYNALRMKPLLIPEDEYGLCLPSLAYVTLDGLLPAFLK